MATPASESLADEDKLNAAYPEKYRECKAGGHSWRWRPEGRGRGLVTIVGICRSCRSRRIDVLSELSGSLISRRYEYQDGYNIGYHTRDDYRRNWLEAVLSGVDEDEEEV